MATGVQSWSKTAGTNATADTNVNWSEGQSPSSINDSARAEMASVAKWRDDISGTVTTAGSSTAYTMTSNQGFATAAAMSGAMLTFIPHATSGLNPTLAVDGLTARAINQSTGVAVPTGALVLGTPYVVTYIHASTEFILQGALGAATFNDPVQILSTDAGAGIGPVLDLYRNSASPAVNDVLGSVDFNGKDSAANKQIYSRVFSKISDPVSTSEDADLFLQTIIAGTMTVVLQSIGIVIYIPGSIRMDSATLAASLTGGTTAQRNGSPTAGDTRYNTTLNGLEYWNGTAWIVLGQAPTVQIKTSGTGATYTAAAGVVRQRVRIVAPGGGGGATATNAGANGSADASFQVNATGTAWTAVKGSGGAAASGAPGAGGTGGTDGSTGTLVVRVAGQNGFFGLGSTTTNTIGGAGGNSAIGGGGTGNTTGTGATAKANSGGGGQGGGSSSQNCGAGGGAGEYVEFWVTGMTTATYTVGTGGNGGSAGTNAGGNGAAGIIIIEEFYS